MELTGLCEQEFKKWYLTWVFKEKTYLSLNFSEHQILENWKSLHDSEKYGVLVDYFDSVDINLTVSYDSMISAFNWWLDSEKNYSGKERSRQEARTKAIEKANEFRNQELNL